MANEITLRGSYPDMLRAVGFRPGRRRITNTDNLVMVIEHSMYRSAAMSMNKAKASPKLPLKIAKAPCQPARL